jgi:hypothetical protein
MESKTQRAVVVKTFGTVPVLDSVAIPEPKAT